MLPPNLLFRKSNSDCKTSREKYELRNKEYLDIVYSIAKDFPNVFVFHSSKYLCDNSFCYARKGDIALYRDHGHLSYDGSIFIGRKLIEELKNNGL